MFLIDMTERLSVCLGCCCGWVINQHSFIIDSGLCAIQYGGSAYCGGCCVFLLTPNFCLLLNCEEITFTDCKQSTTEMSGGDDTVDQGIRISIGVN